MILFSLLTAAVLLQASWMVRAALISLDRSSSLAARYPMKVAVTFSSGIVLDMSPGLMSTGTPPSSETWEDVVRNEQPLRDHSLIISHFRFIEAV